MRVLCPDTRGGPDCIACTNTVHARHRFVSETTSTAEVHLPPEPPSPHHLLHLQRIFHPTMETASDAESTPACPNTPDSDKCDGLTVQHPVNVHRCRLQCTFETSRPELIKHHIISTHDLDKSEDADSEIKESAPPNTDLHAPPAQPFDVHQAVSMKILRLCIFIVVQAIFYFYPDRVRAAFCQ